ncbi:MAG: hypothetical protein COA78_20940 [Blastopirellula sp.]|nr:MAG: hypothetical protein COA78_20940 [Blastopirellula sp.]
MQALKFVPDYAVQALSLASYITQINASRHEPNPRGEAYGQVQTSYEIGLALEISAWYFSGPILYLNFNFTDCAYQEAFNFILVLQCDFVFERY